MKRLSVTALLGLAVAAVSSALAANPYVVLPSGQKVEGTRVRAEADGSIILTTDKGQMTFPKGTKLVMDEPADYAKAVQMADQGQYDKAIESLEKIAAEYRNLEFGWKAEKAVASVYVRKGDYKKGVSAYEALFTQIPDFRNEEGVLAWYLRALQGAGNTAKLKTLLDPSIATGPRDAAAVAQVLRGKDRLAAGDIEGALSDFLRTSELFRDEPEEQAEATYLTAECFEKLHDPRADEFFKKVVKDYPSSPFAAKAGTRAAAKTP